MKALLFSGGLDSTALAWWLRPDVCVFVDYGQSPAAGEQAAAMSLAGAMDLRLETVSVDLSHLGLGPLAGRPPSDLAVGGPEWWPYRNQMLVTLAAMHLVGRGLTEIMLGAVSSDRHADGRPPFLRAMNRVMSLQEGAVRVSAPGRRLSGAALLKRSGVPAELLGATFSCHVAEYACGRCRGCTKHRDTLRRFGGRPRMNMTPARRPEAAGV